MNAANAVSGVSSIGPSLTINRDAGDAEHEAGDAAARQGLSFSTGTAVTALQSGTMPFITAR